MNQAAQQNGGAPVQHTPRPPRANEQNHDGTSSQDNDQEEEVQAEPAQAQLIPPLIMPAGLGDQPGDMPAELREIVIATSPQEE